MLFKGIILKAAENINQERSASSIYHLLTGSRNIQSVQDAHIFSNQPFYGIYKELKKNVFGEIVQVLINDGLLSERIDDKNRQVVTLTGKGNKWLQDKASNLPLHYYQGLAYEVKGEVFYKRLLLLVQTLTNTRNNNYEFIPVINQPDIEHFVKRLYRDIKGKEYEYLRVLNQELEIVLSLLPEEEASMFVDRLSGYNYYGKSVDQLANTYKKDVYDVRLLLTGITHFILHEVESRREDFKVLYDIFSDLNVRIKLVGSTGKTYDLFKQGYAPEQISRVRKLKLNTIYDHLAEIALYDPAFPFSSFVTEHEAKEILQAINQAKSFKLKAIKENIQSDISFFQIRLMLVFQHKEGGNKFAKIDSIRG